MRKFVFGIEYALVHFHLFGKYVVNLRNLEREVYLYQQRESGEVAFAM
jgi:hypothetical protein